jgi:hypothetical protein
MVVTRVPVDGIHDSPSREKGKSSLQSRKAGRQEAGSGFARCILKLPVRRVRAFV